jgi:hypothetical protein
MTESLVLDRDVRDWVLIPLTFSVILMMLLRQYATKASAAYCSPTLACAIAETSWRRQPRLAGPGLQKAGCLAWPCLAQFFSSGKPATAPTPQELRDKNAVARSALLRTNAAYIPESGFRQRKAFFTAKVRAGPLGAVGSRLPPL